MFKDKIYVKWFIVELIYSLKHLIVNRKLNCFLKLIYIYLCVYNKLYDPFLNNRIFKFIGKDYVDFFRLSESLENFSFSKDDGFMEISHRDDYVFDRTSGVWFTRDGRLFKNKNKIIRRLVKRCFKNYYCYSIYLQGDSKTYGIRNISRFLKYQQDLIDLLFILTTK